MNQAISTSNQIPETWTWVNLENCVEILDKRRVPINADERNSRIAGKPESQLIPYYGATGQVGWIDDYIFNTELVLLGEDGAPFLDLNKDIAYIIRGKSWVNNHAHVLRAINSLTNNLWLKHYLNIFNFNGFVTGTTRLKLNQSRMRKISVPIAPLVEQQRVVDEIEKQFARLDAAVANLKRVQTNLERYKASVLKAACEGRLVPQDPDDEPAEVLLKRILIERRRKWEEQEWRKLIERSKKKAAQAKRRAEKRPARISDLEAAEWQDLAEEEYRKHLPKNDKWKEKYKEPEPVDAAGLPELPEGWVWATLKQLTWASSYGTSEKCDYEGSGPAVLRIPNIVEGRIDVEDLKNAVDTSLESEETKAIQPGDLLIIRTNGSRKLIGRSALVRQIPSTPLFFASYLIRFRIISEYPISFWLAAIWDSQYVRSWIESTAATSAGQYNISLTALDTLVVPVPPAQEQHKIIEMVEGSLSNVRMVHKALDINLARAERLRQATLEQAFSGRLVPQNPDDEPASVLLERIHTKRATYERPKRKKSRKMQTGEVMIKPEQVRHGVFEVLKTDGGRMTPEELFRMAGFNEQQVDEFYAELRKEIEDGRIAELRPNAKDIFLEASSDAN